MKKNILFLVIVFFIFSFLYYNFFNFEKKYSEMWNIYIPNTSKFRNTTYGNIVSLNFMKYSDKTIKKILDRNEFKKIDDNVFEIYNYIAEDTLEKYFDLKDNIKHYDYYYLLVKDNDTVKYDLLLLSSKNARILSINNCNYFI